MRSPRHMYNQNKPLLLLLFSSSLPKHYHRSISSNLRSLHSIAFVTFAVVSCFPHSLPSSFFSWTQYVNLHFHSHHFSSTLSPLIFLSDILQHSARALQRQACSGLFRWLQGSAVLYPSLHDWGEWHNIRQHCWPIITAHAPLTYSDKSLSTHVNVGIMCSLIGTYFRVIGYFGYALLFSLPDVQ